MNTLSWTITQTYMHNGKVNDIRYDGSENLTKQLGAKENPGETWTNQSPGNSFTIRWRFTIKNNNS